MDDLTLMAVLADASTIYVTPLDPLTYAEHIEEDVLGGGDGYFIVRSAGDSFEILAKAPSFDAAGLIFDLIVSSNRRLANAA